MGSDGLSTVVVAVSVGVIAVAVTIAVAVGVPDEVEGHLDLVLELVPVLDVEHQLGLRHVNEHASDLRCHVLANQLDHVLVHSVADHVALNVEGAILELSRDEDVVQLLMVIHLVQLLRSLASWLSSRHGLRWWWSHGSRRLLVHLVLVSHHLTVAWTLHLVLHLMLHLMVPDLVLVVVRVPLLVPWLPVPIHHAVHNAVVVRHPLRLAILSGPPVDVVLFSVQGGSQHQ